MVTIPTTTNNDFYLAAITSIGFWCIVSMCICVVAFYQLCRDEQDRLNALYRNLTLVCITLFTLCCIGDCIHVIMRFVNFPEDQVFESDELICLLIVDFIYYCGNILFYVLLLLRIYNVFKLSKRSTMILSIIIIISALSSLTYCIIGFYFGSRYDLPGYFSAIKHVSYPLTITDFMLNINLFIIFIYKMKNTLIDIDRNLSIYDNIQNALAKHIVLFGSGLITNELFFVWTFYYSHFPETISEYNTIPLITITYMIRSFEVAINILILWLLTAEYNTYSFFCKCCHLCVTNVCITDNEARYNPYHQMQSL